VFFLKAAFISDIHGNATALESVLNDLEKRQVDQIFILGDLCYRGPEPRRSLELVRSLHSPVIKGNADEWVVRGVRKGEVPDQALEMMNLEREWTMTQLDEESLKYLDGLPTELKLEFGGKKVHAFHATPDSLLDVVSPFEKNEVLLEKMMKEDADLYIYAHIHRPYVRYLNGRCIMNIGSVGMPFDTIGISSYGLIDIEDNCFQTSIVKVNFNLQKVIRQMDEFRYPVNTPVRDILEKGNY
jgi:putative phosphoesterase